MNMDGSGNPPPRTGSPSGSPGHDSRSGVQRGTSPTGSQSGRSGSQGPATGNPQQSLGLSSDLLKPIEGMNTRIDLPPEAYVQVNSIRYLV